MKNPTSIIIGIVIIIAVVFFALQYANTDTSAPQITPYPSVSPVTLNEFTQPIPSTMPTVDPKEALKIISVTIDDSGFTPATVTVPVGAKVLFVNNGQATHWPASDPHPTHGGLAGLDAKKPLTTGEVYSFTFDKAGTFGMHDHLHADMKATIIVQ